MFRRLWNTLTATSRGHQIKKKSESCTPMMKDADGGDTASVVSSGRLEMDSVKVPDQGVSSAQVGLQVSTDVCRIEDSPFRILKLASSGNLKEFQKVYAKAPSRLSVQDSKGQTVVHHAASRGRTKILEFIAAKKGDLDAQDNKGNTALHIAVEKDQSGAVEALLRLGADSGIQNEAHLPPVHLAVELDKTQVLEELLKCDRVDPNQGAELGGTPLHTAAHYDRAKCASLLLQYGAKLCKQCDVGYYPIHVAAKSGASDIMEVFFSHGEKLGCSREKMISFKDKDMNLPLHAAVNSGDPKAVEMCLRFGAQIDAQQHDKSTPVHLACSQGNLAMLQMMFSAQPERVTTALQITDAMGMTPLHTSVLFDQEDCAQFLIDKGSYIDEVDSEKRTPLLLAASRQGWRSVRLLISRGATLTVKDAKSRNFLHVAIHHGAKIADVMLGEIPKDVQDLLNDRDDLGCTPLHYASRAGHLGALTDLLNMGAFLNIKDNDKQSPLHFAARYGRLNTCIRLLDSSQGPHIINETDGDGLTALHIASQNGHFKVAQCLMQRGAMLHRDHGGFTPLHLAASNGYTQTMKLLLGVHSHILNAQNKVGDTALHLAAREGQATAVLLLMGMGAEFLLNEEGNHFLNEAIWAGHKDVALSVISHDRWREALNIDSKNAHCPMIELVKHLPEACKAVLDRCRTPSGHDEKHSDFHHLYDFRYLQCPLEWMRKQKAEGGEFTPMLALNTMVKFNRVDCLSHPVCVTFLQMKWRAYGSWVHMLNIGVYAIFLAFLTTFVVDMDPRFHVDSKPDSNSTSFHGNGLQKMDAFHKVGFFVMTAFCALNMLKEFFQMYQQRLKYFTDWNNALEWVLYITAGFFVFPLLFQNFTHEQWECGAIAIFLAWFNLLLYFRRFDFFGIYVVMFLEIMKTLMMVIVVFSILIIAFGLAFYILLMGEETPAYRSPGLSFMRTFVMMLGEIDYITIFVDPYADDDAQTMHYAGLTFTFLVLFILLMPILLMNLLIGLAVGDIEAVQRNARLKRLAMQVELHTDLERKLPHRILEYVDKSEYKVYRNCGNHFLSWILGRVFQRDEDGGGSIDSSCQENEGADSVLMEEVLKQKRRLKEISVVMEKQHDLLRLVVQKMEIRSEADDQDVGVGASPGPKSAAPALPWAPVAKHAILRKATIISKWSNTAKPE